MNYNPRKSYLQGVNMKYMKILVFLAWILAECGRDCCLEGWTGHGEFCYQFVSNSANWFDARRVCKEKNRIADLISVENEEETQFLKNLMSDHGWIGFNKCMNGNWCWIDKSQSNYTNWQEGEPNYPEAEECVSVYTTPEEEVWKGKWNNVKCSKRLHFVCSFKSNSSECPSGWMFNNRVCYYFSSYATTWERAISTCQDMNENAGLASVHSQVEQDFVTKYIPNDAFIGLKMLRIELAIEWHWTDGSPADFINWNAREPNFLEAENCAVMYRNNGKWNDVGCAGHWQFVCKMGSKEESPPRIVSTQLNGGVTEVEPGSVLELDCQAEGWLEPDISWFRTISGEMMKEEKLNMTGAVLRIHPVARTDVGKYTCKATNQAGQAEAFVNVQLTGYDSGRSTRNLAIVLVTVAVIAFLLAALGIFLCRYVYIQRKQLRELAYDLELVHGDENRIEPDLPINDQPENLYYDPKWEFNRHRVKLGKKLGSGAFGVVYEAEAVGIDGSDGAVKVAAKTVKPPASVQELKSLIDEMKMMAHVGKHLNVVSLLGACTRNLRSGTLLVLVEYCKYGNILQVLRRRREDYVDEMDPITGMIDRRGDVHLDLEGRTTTTHLVSWSLQVARGMGHLGSKMVVHRDLAARNVLLCSNNVVKICDFGLAREEYYYKKKKKKGEGGGLLPVKWMAIESIRDRTFSTMSDVWSYGVLLWEIFSLGEDPYPGINIRDVYRGLLDGYRMSKPKLQPFSVYQLMTDCWKTQPEERPTFSHLESKICSLMEERVEKFYLTPGETRDEPEQRYLEVQPSCSRPTSGYLQPDAATAQPPPGYANVTPVSPDGYCLMSSRRTDPASVEAMEMKIMGSQHKDKP